MFLELLQLADSAIPIGAVAHSFGLETLIEDEVLRIENLEAFLRDHLQEAGALEARFVRRAWQNEDPAALSYEFEARRTARESREAACKMGHRFAELVNTVCGADIPSRLAYPVAFGAAGVALEIPEESIVLAYLQQSITGLVSACQRLMPLGQVAARRMLWNLRPAIKQAVLDSKEPEVSCFTPLVEIGSMRHSFIETRLFIS